MNRWTPGHSWRERLGSEERALPEQVFDRRDQLKWIEGLLEERVGAVFERLVAGFNGEIARTRLPAPEGSAETRPRTA